MNFSSKRESSQTESEISPSPKRMKGAPGGGVAKGGAAQDDKVDPIPRHLKEQSVTLHFVQRSWEEIGPGELKYLPINQCPQYIFDQAMKNQYNKFVNLWSTMEIHTPKVRLSNLIMLQDDLINQGGTPLETTAFTQACYLMTYRPSYQNDSFILACQPCGNDTKTVLTYNFRDLKCDNFKTWLVNLKNYTNFEDLQILPYKHKKYGVVRGGELDGEASGTVHNTYIHPADEIGSVFSGNYQPDIGEFFEPNSTVTWAKNTDDINLHKYGDTVTIPIQTNLEGIKLIHDDQNYMFKQQQTVKLQNGKSYTYESEFAYPGYNRPYFTRKDGLMIDIPSLSLKSHKRIPHTFLTMPPIKKANGALLKQRCSFLMEQEFSITFNFTESVFPDDSVSVTDDEGELHALHSAHAALNRPLMYGIKDAGLQNAFCGMDVAGSCAPNRAVNKCPTDFTFTSLVIYIMDHTVDSGQTITDSSLVPFPDLCTKANPCKISKFKDAANTFIDLAVDPDDNSTDISVNFPLNNLTFTANKGFQIAWLRKRYPSIQNTFLRVRVKNVPVKEKDTSGESARKAPIPDTYLSPYYIWAAYGQTNWVLCEPNNEVSVDKLIYNPNTNSYDAIVRFDMDVLNDWMEDTGIVCNPKPTSKLESASTEAYVFFC